MSPTARHPRPTTAVPACDDCDDTGTITDPAPDAPRARPLEPCVSCPGRTLPVTPAERFCATVLRAYLTWNTDEANDPEGTTAWWSMVKLGEYLKTRCLVEPTGLSATPAGRDLLARVEAAERTPTAPDPDLNPEPRKCPVCLAATYRDDGIAYCTDHEPIAPQLSERARKALAALSLAEPRDFARLTWLDLLKVDGCGTKTRAELLAWAGEHGAHLIHRLPKRERDALASKEPR